MVGLVHRRGGWRALHLDHAESSVLEALMDEPTRTEYWSEDRKTLFVLIRVTDDSEVARRADAIQKDQAR